MKQSVVTPRINDKLPTTFNWWTSSRLESWRLSQLLLACDCSGQTSRLTPLLCIWMRPLCDQMGSIFYMALSSEEAYQVVQAIKPPEHLFYTLALSFSPGFDTYDNGSHIDIAAADWSRILEMFANSGNVHTSPYAHGKASMERCSARRLKIHKLEDLQFHDCTC